LNGIKQAFYMLEFLRSFRASFRKKRSNSDYWICPYFLTHVERFLKYSVYIKCSHKVVTFIN